MRCSQVPFENAKRVRNSALWNPLAGIFLKKIQRGGSEAPAIDVKMGGATIGAVATQPSQGPSGSSFYDVLINLDPDGTLDVDYNGASIFSNLATGYTPILNGRFGLGARTGGYNDNHWIDDLTIETQVVPEASTYALFGLGAVGLMAWRRRKTR